MASEPRQEGQPRRLKKREIERMQRERRKLLFAVVIAVILALAITGAIMLAPAAVPPPVLERHKLLSNQPMHIHPHLTILVDGVERQVPSNIGLQGGVWASHEFDHYLDLREGQQGQLSPLHTHDSSGTIHVEAAVTFGFILDDFFQVWGQPLGPDQTWNLRADGAHTLTLTVDNVISTEWGNLLLRDGSNIVIQYNTV